MNDRLYFFANDGVHGKELWQSDGTPGGTTMVEDTTPGPVGLWATYATLPEFTAICGALYFSVDDGVHGPELWRYEPYSFIPISVAANGEHSLLIHSNAAGDLEITVSIDPLMAAGVEADWWLEAESPRGSRFWYDRTGGWRPVTGPPR